MGEDRQRHSMASIALILFSLTLTWFHSKPINSPLCLRLLCGFPSLVTNRPCPSHSASKDGKKLVEKREMCHSGQGKGCLQRDLRSLQAPGAGLKNGSVIGGDHANA